MPVPRTSTVLVTGAPPRAVSVKRQVRLPPEKLPKMNRKPPVVGKASGKTVPVRLKDGGGELVTSGGELVTSGGGSGEAGAAPPARSWEGQACLSSLLN